MIVVLIVVVVSAGNAVIRKIFTKPEKEEKNGSVNITQTYRSMLSKTTYLLETPFKSPQNPLVTPLKHP